VLENCSYCFHGEEEHRDDICYGDRFCCCIKFEVPVNSSLNITTKPTEQSIIYSRTDIALPQFITTHDNWGEGGWKYKEKWGRTQSEMVAFLSVKCGLNNDEIRRFLRCKASSVRGRLSEMRTPQKIIIK